MAALIQHVASNALHSADRPGLAKCHPKTRVAILERITGWIESLEAHTVDRLIMWLHGPAGTGKTAIAQTLAELFHERGILLAAFFFSRFDDTRNRSRSLISTIAYQAALSLPLPVRTNILSAIAHDPLLFKKSLSNQMTTLLLDPLASLPEDYFIGPKCNRVIIIDGLDECEDRTEQVAILEAIAGVVRKHCIPLSFIIASRPEPELKRAFNTGGLEDLSISLPLNDDLQSSTDIELFLRDRFESIKRNHQFKQYIPLTWPGDNVINRLVYNSSGHFIYAATVIKFVEFGKKQPHLQLDIVLGIRSRESASPFEELDALYTHILKSVENPKLVLQILALFLLRQQWLPPLRARLSDPTSSFNLVRLSNFEDLLCLPSGEADVALCDLGSLLEIRDSIHGSRDLRFFHASFQDFLLDKSRSGIFHIDDLTRHGEIAHYYFQQFQRTFEGNDLLRFSVHLKLASQTPTLLADVLNVSFPAFSRHCRQRNMPKQKYEDYSHAFLNVIKDFVSLY
ncbi:hypothetical protein GALMADRAFT_159216 [Galerina marginata CBS 339.88]|uniref:NACHT domain-containing protein n=1 Tax=Galerina marginata (strain CBS 339.88) TaxID=685588 RepID=A0A067SP47_GALM3|nr:hypothetical protein GALMADRAFT_159216 [Galerina marginata CBS 339.88]